MIKIARFVLSAALAVSLSGCIVVPYHHRHWYPAYYGHAGYWR